MHRSKIEWVLNPDNKTLGWVWNPITGCLNGCPYCYARRLANGRLKERYLANKNLAYDYLEIKKAFDRGEPFQDPFYPRFWPERLEQIERPPAPSAWYINNASYTKPHEFEPVNRHAKRKARGIFTCDMSDLFGIGIPEEWTWQVLDAIRINSVDRFYLLTKQPQNLIKWSPFPDNVYIGVTATNAKMAEEAGFWLWEVKATVKFVSFEPLLERVAAHFVDYISDEVEGIKWVIIGAMTCSGGDLAKLSSQFPELTPKPFGNRYVLLPKIEWVQEIVDAADKADIPVFLKDNLKPLVFDDPFFAGVCRLGAGELRQEMPEFKGVE